MKNKNKKLEDNFVGKKLDLNYFYGAEADQFNFIKIPKPLLFDPMYKDVKLAEAVVYSMLLDRMSLSIKNGWFDEMGRAYVYCSIERIMEFADCGRNKAGDILKNLDAIGLIEKVLIPGRGLKIYVKNFIPKDMPKFENQTLEEKDRVIQGMVGDNKALADKTGEVVPNPNDGVCFSNGGDCFLNGGVCESNDTQPESKSEVVYFLNTNKNNINNNSLSNNKSNQTISVTGSAKMMGYDDDERVYADIIRENISFDILMERYPCDRDFLQGVYDLILETVLSTSDYILVASSQYSANFVKGKLLKLNSMHIEYVMDCWNKNKEKPRNVKKYLLAALFNAPSTIGAFYQAEVNHDMAYGIVN